MHLPLAKYRTREAVCRYVYVWAIVGGDFLLGTTATLATEPPVDFVRQIRPILANNCFRCHGPDKEMVKAGLRLDTREGAAAETESGSHAIVPGKPEASELIARVSSTDENIRMPPAESGKALTAAEIELLKRWIKQEAPYRGHWAFLPPQRPPLPPAVSDPGWVRNPIDALVLAKLDHEGLPHAPEADRSTLLRRLALDLTGLPPTLAEVDQFVTDQSPEAYEKSVDRLLASPAYGERWARVWLDLARYADSAGYAQDPPRTIWRYRDWVIQALNSNLPFDQFTIQQIAGDLLPSPTEDQRIATAFHRNTMTNSEGGTDDEEFRNVALVDRVNTTMEVWMGLTMGCAQCHNHKYDPISQEEYFRFFAILNNTEDADRGDEAPNLVTFTPEEEQRKQQLQAEIAELEKSLAENGKLKQLQQQLAGLAGTLTPIMRELPPGKRRTTNIQIRGNFLNKGQEVTPGVPAAFHPLPDGAEPNRLTLAQWLVDARNPLTARVAVNRFWEQLFGIGLVETSEDFGLQGEPPSHPDLLDFLATELLRLKWDTKQWIKLVVTSATYRQSSRVTADLAQRDPHNRLLARGPRFRLSAELVRDQALAVGGLLSRKMYGPPVRPPQPNLGLNSAFGGSTDWTTSAGEDKYRRGLYTALRRTSPYPSMITFDAPSGEFCTIRRIRTNTPLQALVTLNDPVYVEAAQALARRMVREGGATSRERAAYGFRLCLSRIPEERELQRLVALFDQARAKYQPAPQAALLMATDPLGPVPQGMDAVDLAAWTVVGNVLLNLDEFLAKP